MTHFAEAGFYFHNDGAREGGSLFANAQPLSYTRMMQHDRLLNLEKEVLGWFLVRMLLSHVRS